MNLRFENRPLRIAIATLAMSGWLLAFNHCAVAAFATKPAHAASEHSHCAGHQAPAKKGQSEELPCCKTLSATAVTAAKNLAGFDALSFVAKDYLTGVFQFPQIQRLMNSCDFDDTGPPGNSSFAESVLQRSILAHAPPLFA